MKTLINVIASVALLFVVSVNASASLSSNVEEQVRAVASLGSNIFLDFHGETVILSGYVDQPHLLLAIENAARDAGAKAVINNLHQIGQDLRI